MAGLHSNSAVGQTLAEVAGFCGFHLTLCYVRQSYSRAPRGIRSVGVNSTHHSYLQNLRCDIL